MKPMEIGIWSARVRRPTPIRSAAEKGSQRGSRLATILNIPHMGKELFRQLGVGWVKRLRLSRPAPCGLAREPF